MGPFAAAAIWIAIGTVLVVFRVPIAGFYRDRLNRAGRAARASARAANTSTMMFLGGFALLCGCGLVVFGISRLIA